MKSKLGYKKGSPYLNEEEIVINSNHITTENMAFPIIANGVPLFPNTGDYIFEGTDKVVEKPLKKFQNAGSFFSSMQKEMQEADEKMDAPFILASMDLGPFDSRDYVGAQKKAKENKKFNPDFVPALGVTNLALNKFSEFMRTKELQNEYRRMQTLSNIPVETKLTDTGRYGNPYVMQQGGEVNDMLMGEWNNYLGWLDKKGMRGKPDLDKNNVGFNLLDEYRKENPKTILNKEAVPQIQNYLKDYREWVIEGHKTGKRPVEFTEKPNEDYSNFMPFISEYEKQGRKWGDGYPGQYTTSVRFPSEYINEKRIGYVKKFQMGGMSFNDISTETVFQPNVEIPTVNNTTISSPAEIKTETIPTENVRLGKNQEGKTNYVFNYLINKGLPKHAAAGITGNLAIESGYFDDKVVAGKKKGDGGKATGIAQWHPDRWTKALKYFTQNNLNPYVLESQLDYVVHEAKERGDLDKTTSAQSAEEAAYIFGKKYERPNDKFAHWGKRKGVAAKLAQYKHGGEYEMSPEELLTFLQMGGEVEYINE